MRVFILHRSLNAAVVLILLEKAVRAFRGQSWQAGEDFAQAVSLALVFYLALNLLQDGRGLSAGLVFACACWCGIGILVAHQQGYRELAMPLGNRVLMAGLLIPVAPIAAALWSSAARGPIQKAAVLAGGCLLVMGIIRTRSAAAVVVLFVMCFIAATAMLRRRRSVIAALLLAVFGAFSAVLLVSGFEPIERLKGVVLRGEDPILSWNNRARYWTGAIPAMRARPVFGHGPGQVGLLYPRYRVQQPVLAPHGEVVPDLHSLPLNWLFEFGFAGLTLRLVLCLGLMGAAFSQGDWLRRSASLGVAGYGLYSLAHYQMKSPAIVCVLFCVALIAAPRRDAIQLSARQATGWGGLLVCAAVFIFAFQCRLDYSNYLLTRSYSQRPAQAAASVIRAAVLDNRNGFYDFVAALRIRALLERQPSGRESDYLFEAADRHYAASLQRIPLMPQVLASYGTFRLRHGGGACAAIQPLQNAVSLDFYFSLSHFDLANAYRSCAQEEMAVGEAAAAILLHPTLVYATHWRKDPDFLDAAIKRSLAWLSQWDAPTGDLERTQLQGLKDFLQANLNSRERGANSIVPLTFSDSVAGQLADDPFAFLFQRRAPYFEITQIRLDGLASGSWAPRGIGSFRWVRAVTYDAVKSVYERHGLDPLVVAVGRRQ